jgi:hypothetical protein
MSSVVINVIKKLRRSALLTQAASDSPPPILPLRLLSGRTSGQKTNACVRRAAAQARSVRLQGMR